MQLFPKRILVRKRIIARNIPMWQLRTVLGLQQIVMFGTGGIVFLMMLGYVSVWWFAVGMFLILALTSLYARLWFKMLNNMRNSKDRIFVKKMIKDEW